MGVEYCIEHVNRISNSANMIYQIRGWVDNQGSDNIVINILDKKGNSIKPIEMSRFTVKNPGNKSLGFRINVPTPKVYLEFQKDENELLKRIDIYRLYKKKSASKKYFFFVKLLKHITPRNVIKLISYVLRNGVKELKKDLVVNVTGHNLTSSQSYYEWFKTHRINDEEKMQQKKYRFKNEPLVSILVPTYNTPIPYLEEMLESVLVQTYSNWELCIADGSGGNAQLEETLDKYAKRDSRVKVKLLKDNNGISGNTNEALSMASGDIISLFDHDDVLEPDALYETVKCFQDESVGCVYTDEDKISGLKWINTDPNFKPDFNIDLLRSYNYITHFFSVRKSIMDKVGGFRSEYDGAQDYDVILRCVELSEKIGHVPKVLYHWRMHEASTASNPESKMYCFDAGKRALEDHFNRLDIKAEVLKTDVFCTYRIKYKVSGTPMVSVVICNNSTKEDLDNCINNINQRSSYRNYEIMVVDTFKEIKSSDCKGDYLLLLHSDTEIINSDSIEDMLAYCQRSEVGAVGAKLIYEDNTIQHAGIILGLGGIAGYAFEGLPADEYGYLSRAYISADYSAVTAACMMVSKEIFNEVGGFEEELDFCLKIREKGYLVVYDAFSKWYHYSSKSGRNAEWSKFEDKWIELLKKHDSCYNINYSNNGKAYSLDYFFADDMN